ncbi:hypothetical protein QTP70_019485 [Hemibagrus guttatus]|uniref:NR LBD domain-containing protein n=1 Tax=Hemibagrus guttatus TaxID=175788 RepID=A0AAE0QUV8_9TELE|nr:hypothetical protein QTP70_019485 [Hemibagrus guttatus]KAK3562241.1 hypothetical protein QTP86_032204 [Hemibagrus guttatus]
MRKEVILAKIKHNTVSSAVQNERDRISCRREAQGVGTLTISILLKAEESTHQVGIITITPEKPISDEKRDGYSEQAQSEADINVILRDEKISGASSGLSVFSALTPPIREVISKKIARPADVCESIKQQLLLLVEWAKRIPEFCELPVDDRVSLLRAHSAEHLILGVARRSLPYNDVILLGNDFIIPMNGPELEMSKVAARVLEELVRPLRELDITDTEFACLRAIVFFAPGCPGLESAQMVRRLRFQAHMLLDEATCEQRGRFGELLLLLPPLQSTAWHMVEQLQLARLLGEASMDSLLQEMLLGESASGANPEVLGFSSPVDPVLPRNLHPEHVALQNFTSVILPVPSSLAGVPLLAVQPGTQLYTHTPSAEMPLDIDSCLTKPAVHTCL